MLLAKALIKLIVTLFCMKICIGCTAERVFICKGPGAKKYHKVANCNGVRNCSTDVYGVDIKAAKGKYHMQHCKICY